MDKIEKALKKLSEKEKELVKDVLTKLQRGNVKELDIKKLKGRENIFRVRKGDIRIIYQVANKKIFTLAINRCDEKTYKI